jgi:hypothetical protein
MYNVSIILVQ